MKLSIAIAGPDTADVPVTFLTGSFEKKLKKAKNMGYSGVEILFSHPENCDCSYVKKVVSKYNLKVSALGTGAIFLLRRITVLNKDKDTREKAEQFFRKLVEIGAQLDAPVTIGSFRGWLKNLESKSAYDYAVETFKKLLEYAGKHAVNVFIEPLNRYETDLVNNAGQAIKFIKDTGKKNFFLLLDTFHMNIEEVDYRGVIFNSKKLLRHVHLGDSNRLSPGKGHFDFMTVLKALKEIGFKGYLSAEHLARPDLDVSAKETAEYMNKICKELIL